DGIDRRVEVDRQERDGRVGCDERAVASAACVVAAADVGELPPEGCTDEKLACVRIRERGPDAPEGVRVVEKRAVAARLPALATGLESKLFPAASCNRLVVLAPEGRVHCLVAVEGPREHFR